MKDDEAVFITNDAAVHKKRKLDKTDEKILDDAKSGRGIVIESLEQLEALAKGLSETYDYCVEFCRKNMTKEQATCIRELRVDKGYSWRAIARACHELNWWPKDEYWDRVPSAQPMGMALAKVAAEFFGENSEKPPWN